jgi:hypothetical protein
MLETELNTCTAKIQELRQNAEKFVLIEGRKQMDCTSTPTCGYPEAYE